MPWAQIIHNYRNVLVTRIENDFHLNCNARSKKIKEFCLRIVTKSPLPAIKRLVQNVVHYDIKVNRNEADLWFGVSPDAQCCFGIVAGLLSMLQYKRTPKGRPESNNVRPICWRLAACYYFAI